MDSKTIVCLVSVAVIPAIYAEARQAEESREAQESPAADERLSQESTEGTSAAFLDPAELEAFVDGYMASYLEEADIAGATVAAIEGETIVFAEGYGFADVDERIRVDPETTLFRIGSVSKLFIWTAVMQLVEEGELELDADLNQYLGDLEIPEAFGEPITMAQLMSHTAGFDERVLGLFAKDASALRPLGDILRDELPDRIRPPEDLVSYSNHGTALAMYVVEQISGMSWDDYIEQKILEPLQMNRTSFEQPLPEPLSASLSEGYRFEGGELVEAPFEFIPLAPVGAAASTASDMSRFLAAHLRLGQLEDARILEEDTARRMQTTLFRPHPGVNGMAHGFIEMDLNGQRILGHGGDTELFHTLFAFFPEHDIGLFASFNTAGANYARFLEAFVDWRFPIDESAAPEALPTAGLGRFAGTYRTTRFPHDTIAKIAALVSTVEVRVENDHLVTTGAETRRWYAVEPLLFREEGTSATMAFRESEDAAVTHLFFSEAPVVAFERAPDMETPNVVGAIVGGGAALALATVLFWPIAAGLRWHYGVSLAAERRVPLFARWSLWLAALALVVFLVGLSLAFSDFMEVVYGLSPTMQSLFWLPLIAAVLTVLAAFGALVAWHRKRGSFLGRVTFTLVVVAIGLLLWQLAVWNLLGFNY